MHWANPNRKPVPTKDRTMLTTKPQCLLLAAAILVIGPTLRRTSAQSSMRGIIENVKSFENAYKNLEVIITSSYKFHDYKGNLRSPTTFSSFVRTRRCVYQDGMIYMKSQENNETVDGDKSNYLLTLGYNGEVTRLLDNDVVGNIHDGQFEHSFLYRPHTCLLDRARVDFPLSLYLEGGEAVRAEPSYKDVNLRVVFVGREKCEGFDCCKIRTDWWATEQKPDEAIHRYLWLAIERNYLPVKTEAYVPQRNESLPLETATVDRFEEVEPGIWFPMATSLKVYDPLELMKNKLKVANEEQWIAEKVDLHPKYEKSLFSNVPFPDGAVVYELANGKLKKSYVQGAPAANSSNSYLIFILLGLLGLVLVVFYLIKHRNAEHAPPAHT